MNKQSIIIEDGLNLYQKTGQGQYTQNIYDILIDMGYQVEMKRKPFMEKIKNSTVKRILYILWINFVFPISTMFKNADIIIFTNTLTPFYKIPNKKYYPVLHDLWAYKSPETVTFIQSLYTRIVIASIKNTYEKIITVSETIKQEIVDFFNCSEEDVNVVYNYFSFGEKPVLDYSKEEQLKILSKYNIESKKYILSVATLNKRKNIPMLIDAYSQLDSDIKLVLVGKASSESFNCNNQNIIFTGYLSDDELKVLYKHAFLYVFPSVYEGFGIPIIDAQAFGIPVICSNIPVFKEIAGKGAEFCELNILDVVKKIKTILEDNYKENLLIQNGYNNIQKFLSSQIKKQVIMLLESTHV
jgi:glycosyltransferase involved in cell wall biosynthesis